MPWNCHPTVTKGIHSRSRWNINAFFQPPAFPARLLFGLNRCFPSACRSMVLASAILLLFPILRRLRFSRVHHTQRILRAFARVPIDRFARSLARWNFNENREHGPTYCWADVHARVLARYKRNFPSTIAFYRFPFSFLSLSLPHFSSLPRSFSVFFFFSLPLFYSPSRGNRIQARTGFRSELTRKLLSIWPATKNSSARTSARISVCSSSKRIKRLSASRGQTF